jgi:hypothetical protein
MLGLADYGSSDDEDNSAHETPKLPAQIVHETPKTILTSPTIHDESDLATEETNSEIFSALPKPSTNNKKRKRTKKLKTSQIAGLLGLDSIIDNTNESEEEKEETVADKTENSNDEPSKKKVKYNSKFMERPPPQEMPEVVSSAPSLREGSDFMLKFASQVKTPIEKPIEVPETPLEQSFEPSTITSKAPPLPASLFKSAIKPIKTMKPSMLLKRKSTSTIAKPVPSKPTTLEDEECEMDEESFVPEEQPVQEERGLFIPQTNLTVPQAPIIINEKITVGEKLRREKEAQQAQTKRRDESMPALPDEVLREISKAGGAHNMIDVSDRGTQYADEASQRKIMIEKHKQSLYISEEEKQNTLKVFNSAQRTRNQITFLAKSAQVSQQSFSEASANARATKKQTMGKYGWI